jgi:hypothetical protein
MSCRVEGPSRGVAALCEPILRSLPDWFGIEEAIVQYDAEIDGLPTFLACDGDQIAGFLSLKQHNPYSAEVYVMGVRQEMHRHSRPVWHSPALFDRPSLRLHNRLKRRNGTGRVLCRMGGVQACL